MPLYAEIMKRSSVKSNITGYEVCMTLSQEGHINATFRNTEESRDAFMASGTFLAPSNREYAIGDLFRGESV